jgi:hypothetical protein
VFVERFELLEMFVLRGRSVVFEFEVELLLPSVLRLANAKIITINPTPRIAKKAKPPRTHQIALDFFFGGATGCQCFGALISGT